MNPLAKLMAWLKPKPKSAVDFAAEQEAARLREETLTMGETQGPEGQPTAYVSHRGRYCAVRGSGH